MSLATAQTPHREYAARPKDERFPSLEALVQNATEDKRLSVERKFNLRDLHVTPHLESQSVQLTSPRGSAKFTHWSFGQLARTIGAPAAYLRELPVQLAADCINHGIANAPIGQDINVLVRAGNGDPTPTVRAATSDTYGRVWDAELYGSIAHQLTSRDARWTLPPTWTGESAGAYRGDRDSFLVMVNGGSIVPDPSIPTSSDKPHGMFRGILVRNSEVGAAAVVIERILFRAICGNHMLWGAVADRTFRRRHTGKGALRDTIREVSQLAYDWANASAQKDAAIISALIAHEVAVTKEGVIDELRKLGATKEQATAAYDSCELHESASPRSFWGAAQGLTRLSQSSGYQDDRYEMDRIAASLLSRGARLFAMA